MRTEKLELDERFGNEYAGCYVFQEISWLSTTGLFGNTPNTTRITGQVVKTELRGKPLHGCWSRKNPKVIE